MRPARSKRHRAKPTAKAELRGRPVRHHPHAERFFGTHFRIHGTPAPPLSHRPRSRGTEGWGSSSSLCSSGTGDGELPPHPAAQSFWRSVIAQAQPAGSSGPSPATRLGPSGPAVIVFFRASRCAGSGPLGLNEGPRDQRLPRSAASGTIPSRQAPGTSNESCGAQALR
jgi:hypothetical protein